MSKIDEVLEVDGTVEFCTGDKAGSSVALRTVAWLPACSFSNTSIP